MKKEHLLHFFPFLKKEFRKLELSEITSEETFKEFFGDEKIDLSKLNAIYHFQNVELREAYFVSKEQSDTFQKLDKPKRKKK